MRTRRIECSGNNCTAIVTIDLRRHYADPECVTNGSECDRCGLVFCDDCFPRHWHCQFCGDELPPCDAAHECQTCKESSGKPKLTARAIIASPTTLNTGSITFSNAKDLGGIL